MNSEPKQLTRRYKCVITIVLYFCYFVYATNLYITGPSLLDLKKIYKTSVAEISTVNTVRSFAYTLGAINGFAYQRINRQLGVTFFLFIIAVTMALTPHLPSLTILLVNFAVNGFAGGGIESAADVWILEMWQQECAPFVQALHLMFGLGSIITPLYVEPFLSQDTNETAVSEHFHSQLSTPYFGGALAIAFGACLLGGLYFYEKYVPPNSGSNHNSRQQISSICKSDTSSDASVNGLMQSIRTQLAPNSRILALVVLSGALMALFLGMEWSQFIYFPAFAHYSSLHISEQKAALISSGLAVAFTVGRALAIIVAFKLRPHQMIYGSLTILLAANLIFLLLSTRSVTFMWAGNVVYGLGLSPLYACIYAMVEEHTVVTNLIGALFIFLSGLMSAVYPIILGIYIDNEPLVLVYINMLSTGLCFALMLAIYLTVYKRAHYRHFFGFGFRC